METKYRLKSQQWQRPGLIFTFNSYNTQKYQVPFLVWNLSKEGRKGKLTSQRNLSTCDKIDICQTCNFCHEIIDCGNCIVIGQLTGISVSDWLEWFSAISPHDKYKDHQFNSHSLDFNSSLKTVPYPADILPQLPCFWLASIYPYIPLIGWKLSQSEFIVTVNYQLHFYTCPFSKMRGTVTKRNSPESDPWWNTLLFLFPCD